MSTNKTKSKPPSLQMRLFLAGSLLIMSGLIGVREGRKVYDMTGFSRLDNSGMAIPGSGGMSSPYVEQNWMYPIGCVSLTAGLITSIAAGVVAIRQRPS
jgi:hypothetical protein